MARPVWTPATDADRRALADLAAAAERAEAAEEAMWAAARDARAQGVPVDLVAATVRRGRATVYRRLADRDEADGLAPAARP